MLILAEITVKEHNNLKIDKALSGKNLENTEQQEHEEEAKHPQNPQQ